MNCLNTFRQVLIMLWRTIKPVWIVFYFFITCFHFIKFSLHSSLFSRTMIVSFYFCRNFHIITDSRTIHSLFKIRTTSQLLIILHSFLILFIKILFKFIFLRLILFYELIFFLILRSLNETFKMRGFLIFVQILLTK